MGSKFSRLRKPKNESGQALLEYALLITVAVTLSLGFATAFNGIIQNGITSFNAILEKELTSGAFREKFDIWDN